MTATRDGLPIYIKSGMHVGHVIAGVIGRLRPRFHAYVEGIATAGKLLASGPFGRTHVSYVAATMIQHRFQLEPSGKKMVTVVSDYVDQVRCVGFGYGNCCRE